VTGPRQAFEYSLLRVVPRVDRGELINVGVMLYCRPLRFLGVRIDLDAGRLLALDPAADVPSVERALEAVAAVCDQTPAAGSAGQQDIGRRFRWLTAPRSTVVQPGPVHTGLTGCWPAWSSYRRSVYPKPPWAIPRPMPTKAATMPVTMTQR
jgi:hypothetical protein